MAQESTAIITVEGRGDVGLRRDLRLATMGRAKPREADRVERGHQFLIGDPSSCSVGDAEQGMVRQIPLTGFGLDLGVWQAAYLAKS